MATITETQAGQSFETLIVLPANDSIEYKLQGVGPLTIAFSAIEALEGIDESRGAARAVITKTAGVSVPIYFTNAATGATATEFVPNNTYYASIDSPINGLLLTAGDGGALVEIIQRKLTGE